MKRWMVVIAFLFIITLVTACGSEDSATDANTESEDGSYEITIGHAVSQNHSQHKTFEVFKEYVEEESGNQITVEIHPDGQIGNDRELIEGIQVGTVTMAAPSTAPIAGFVPEFEIYDLPFLFESSEQAYEVLDGDIGEEVLSTLEGTGMRGLGYWENGFRHMTNNEHAASSPEDLKGLVIRTMETDMHVSTWEKLGANPTPMAWGDVFVSLQQGTLDGQENPLGTIYDQGIYEVQDYLTLTGHVYSPFAVLINESFYNSLSEELQTIVDEGVELATEENRKMVAEVDTETINELKETGMEVIELSPDELQEFRDATLGVYDEYTDEIGEDLVNSILEEVN